MKSAEIGITDTVKDLVNTIGTDLLDAWQSTRCDEPRGHLLDEVSEHFRSLIEPGSGAAIRAQEGLFIGWLLQNAIRDKRLRFVRRQDAMLDFLIERGKSHLEDRDS